MAKVIDICAAIEDVAPRALQESYDNAGLQVGDYQMNVSAALLCLDVTEDVMAEAHKRSCNLVISHHPLIFKGLKCLTDSTPTERIVSYAIRHNIAIYSAHTNLDAASQGVNYEIARTIGMRNLAVLEPNKCDPNSGIGFIGDIEGTPVLEFLRQVKEKFKIRALRYSSSSPRLVVNRVAVCGGSGGYLIPTAVSLGADAILTGDVKYHDFTSWSSQILIADIGHFESELCTKKIFSRIIREKFPNFVTYFSETEKNPINIM